MAGRFESEASEAYADRNGLVVAFARACAELGHRVGILDDHDPKWPIVYVDLPTGQVSWHVTPEDADRIRDLETYKGSWDQHDLDKNRLRLNRYARADRRPVP